MSLRRVRPSFKREVWVFLSKGLPMGWPRGYPTRTARGGLTFSVTVRFSDRERVGIPASSMALWISPTDWLQYPQPGVSKAALMPSFFISAARAGAVSPMSRSSREPRMCPMKEK